METIPNTLSLAMKIMLATVAFVTAFSAIGGETYTQGSGPFLRRITTRGRVAISCAILTFLLGAVDQLVSAHESDKKDREITRLLSEGKDGMNRVLREAQEARIAVAAVRSDLGAASDNIRALQPHIESTRALLAELNEVLKDPVQRADLDKLKKRLEASLKDSSARLASLESGVEEVQKGLAGPLQISEGSVEQIQRGLARGGPVLEELGRIKASLVDKQSLQAAVESRLQQLAADMSKLRTELGKGGDPPPGPSDVPVCTDCSEAPAERVLSRSDDERSRIDEQVN
ncbi:hypothetical protein [Sorangium sp. So ce1097]|uniref:hypothetical protein n=1 Tax=Sorangium sp. So ce1097 TaxID=3133330 RepID=UPI003F622F9F